MNYIFWVGVGRVGAVSVNDGKMFRIGDQRMNRRRRSGAVLEKAKNAIAPTHRKPRNNENKGRNRYSPSRSGGVREWTKSAGATRQILTDGRSCGGGRLAIPARPGPERSEPNAADLPTPDRRQHRPRRGRGARGETMRATTPWRQSNRQDHDPALALLAGVVIVAIKDAQRGCADAAAFLSSQDIPENVWRSSRARMVR